MDIVRISAGHAVQTDVALQMASPGFHVFSFPFFSYCLDQSELPVVRDDAVVGQGTSGEDAEMPAFLYESANTLAIRRAYVAIRQGLVRQSLRIRSVR